MDHLTSSVDPSEPPGEGKLPRFLEGMGSVDIGPLLSVPKLKDCRGESGFPILDRRCWSYASDESFTLRREKSCSPFKLSIDISDTGLDGGVIAKHSMKEHGTTV